MCDENLSRRQLLRYAALVSATFPAARLLQPDWALAEAAGVGAAVPINLELVTVSDTEAIITWFTGDPTAPDEFGRPMPVAAPGRVLIGTDPNPLTWKEVGAHAATPYHYVEVRGLKPGTTYYWRAESNGVPAVATVVTRSDPRVGSAPPVFTTLVPPPGREIGRVAWLNDLHFGEQVAGLAYSSSTLPRGGLPPGFPVDPKDPYWRFMGRGAVKEARARGCDLLLANGDLTNESEPEALAECRSTLDAFGTLGGTELVRPGDAPRYFVTRGNHDRQHGGDVIHTHCEKTAGGLYDCFDDGFRAGFDKGTQHFSVAVGDARARYRFVGLDSNDGSTTGVLRAHEMDYLAAELAKGEATIPLFHHPASATAALSGQPPVVDGLDVNDAKAFRDLLGRHDNVAGVYAGHTHRNNFSTNSETGRVPYFEGGAVKEYPGGYTVVRLFEGGYMANFYKTSSPEARAWSERSRGEYLGLAPSYQLGSLSDRNWTFDVNARRTARVVTGRPARPAPADQGMAGVHGSLAATGAPVALAVAGAAAVAAGVGLHRGLSSER